MFPFCQETLVNILFLRLTPERPAAAQAKVFMKNIALFIKGTLILTLASLATRVLGFFYKIFLAQVLGAEGMGIYQLIFPVFGVCHSLTTSGIETAVSRFTAFDRGKHQGDYLRAGLFLSVSASLAVAVLLWLQADFIAAHLLHEPRCGVLLRILALSIPPAAVHCCYAGSYLGQKKAGTPAAAQLLEQSVRIGSVWLLCSIALKQGKEITPALAVFGLLAGEVSSSLFMLTFSKISPLCLGKITPLFSRCKELLSMSIPLTGSRLSLSLLQSLEAVLIPLTLRQSGLSPSEALSLYGILTGMALSFLLFPNAATASISAMLLPVISEEQAKGNQKHISLAIEYTLLFGLIVGFLCMGEFLLFGGSLGTLIFKEPLAGNFLRTLAWICPFLYLTGNLNSILHGLGKPTVTFRNQLISVMVRILTILIFAPRFGIQGVLWGLLASQLISCLLGICAIVPYVQPTIGLDLLVLKPLAAICLSMGGFVLIRKLLPGFRLSLELADLVFSIGMVAVGYVLILLGFGVWKLGRALHSRQVK